MPYFSWKGVDIEGRIHKGKLFAQSSQDLDAVLFKQEIALLRFYPIKQRRIFTTIALDDTIHFFKQISELLSAGVLLPSALLVVCSQITHAQFQAIVDQIVHDIHAGSSFSQALAKHPHVFDSVMVNMVHVGEESSKLATVLAMLAGYLQMRNDFKRGLRTAMLVPSITLLFFTGIAFLIFAFVVPQFAALFEASNQQLPQLTRTMIAISGFVRSNALLYALGLLGFGMMFLKRFFNTPHGKRIQDTILLRLPLIGSLIRQSSLGYFLHAFSMLLQGGMPLLQAMKVAKTTVSNTVLFDNLTLIERDIESGSSLSQAMIYNMAQIFSADTIAIIRVGEESGRLASLLAKAGAVYQTNVQRSLAVIVTLINPLLMVALGAMVTFLIMAVYIPIFNLSHIA